MNRQFRTELKRYVGEPDTTLPRELAELAGQLERRLAGRCSEGRGSEGRSGESSCPAGRPR